MATEVLLPAINSLSSAIEDTVTELNALLANRSRDIPYMRELLEKYVSFGNAIIVLTAVK